MKNKGLFPYLGNKTAIMNQLLKVLQLYSCDVFYDLFGGSGAVTLSYSRNAEKFLNDYDESISIIYYSLASDELFPQFLKEVQSMVCTQETFDVARSEWAAYNKSSEDLLQMKNTDPVRFVKLAADALLLHYCYYGGVIKNCNLSITYDDTARFNNIQSPQKLFEWHKSLRNVTITCENAFTILNNMVEHPSRKMTLLYMDVPYLADNIENKHIETKKTYIKGMTSEDHIRLLELVNKLPPNYITIISNYSNNVYDDWILRNHWHKLLLTKRAVQSASGKYTSTKPRVWECIYSNIWIDIERL